MWPGRRDKPKTKRRNKMAVGGGAVAVAVAGGGAARAVRRMVTGMRETSLPLARQARVLVVVEGDD